MSTNFDLSPQRARPLLLISAFALVAFAGEVCAQQPQPRDYYVGTPGVGLPVAPPAPTTVAGTPPIAFAPASKNVRMFGALYSVESCVYDPGRGVIVAPSRGVGQAVRANDAWIAFINHDGSVHTARWIGIQNAGAERDSMTPPLVLNEPFGSFLFKGVLYLAIATAAHRIPPIQARTLPASLSCARSTCRRDVRSNRSPYRDRRG